MFADVYSLKFKDPDPGDRKIPDPDSRVTANFQIRIRNIDCKITFDPMKSIRNLV